MRWRLALIVVAIAAAALPIPAAAVERVYANAFYATLQPLLTSASNVVPLAVLDFFAVIVAAAWLGCAVRDIAPARGTGTLRAFGRIAARTAIWSAGLYLAFLIVWGFNYRR